MRRLSAQWCLQMNGFIFGTCVLLSYQSHPYKESALIPVPMESWRGYETVECTTLIFLEVSEYLPEMTRRFESPRIYEIDFQTDLLYSSPTQPCVWKKQRSFA